MEPDAQHQHAEDVVGAHHHPAHLDPAGPTDSAAWSMAVQATLHCLTGCAIGEVLGMIVGTSLGLHN